MRDLIGLRARLLLQPGLSECEEVTEDAHEVSDVRSRFVLQITIVTKMRATPTTAHNESSCLRFFARSFETLHARLLARFDGSPPDSQYLTQESHASPAIGHQLCPLCETAVSRSPQGFLLGT